MIEEKIKKLDWSKEREIYKDNKKLFLKTTYPTTEFWDMWKTDKEKIKSMGIQVNKFNGSWNINWWREETKINTINPTVSISKKIEDQLLSYQIKHTKHLIQAIKKHNSALDASDTGTGKTYCALAVAKELNLFPIVITPKSVISTWKKVAGIFDIDCFISNYEQYRVGKTPYLNLDKEKRNPFTWNVPKNTLLIFDETHRTKNKSTQNSEMQRQAKKQEIKILGLSATIADNPLQMYSIGYVLNLFSTNNGFWSWAKARGAYKGRWGMAFSPTTENLQKIHNDIFPKKGSRISIKELGDLFPNNQIINDCYNMNSNAKKIQKIYQEMYKELNSLKEKEKDDKESPLTIILRARQEIELLKVPTLVELAEDHIEAGNSIAIFVNFSETIKSLSEKLKTKCIIDGSITGEERDKNISDFQSDKERIIICNIRAGGVGISLHDLNGKYSRVSLISPSYSAQDLLQALGRIHRAGAKTKAIQKIIFCSGTIEEDICKKVEKKIKNIHLINDGDLQ